MPTAFKRMGTITAWGNKDCNCPWVHSSSWLQVARLLGGLGHAQQVFLLRAAEDEELVPRRRPHPLRCRYVTRHPHCAAARRRASARPFLRVM